MKIILNWPECSDPRRLPNGRAALEALNKAEATRSESMHIFRMINAAGQMLPHPARRFILDRLGVGRMAKHVTASDSIGLENGMVMHFNPLLHWNVAKPENHERHIVEAMRRHLRDGSVFYDIGANIGLHCLLASSMVGPSGRVLAFEPGDANLRFLRRNAEQAPNIEVYPIAIGREDGTMTFDRRGGAMSGRLVGNAQDAVDPAQVSVRSVDSLIASGLPVPDMIKIDVEGGEMDVVEGAAGTMSRRPAVICELHQSLEESERVFSVLRGAGCEVSISADPAQESQGARFVFAR